MKHTQGEYVASDHKIRAIHGTGHNVVIADMVFGSDQERSANAKFLASTPKLLEAACRAQSLLVELRAHDLDDPQDIETLALLDEAISEATGEPTRTAFKEYQI